VAIVIFPLASQLSGLLSTLVLLYPAAVGDFRKTELAIDDFNCN
jgi:hypothetical protein